jgi:hypothetical protein
LSGNAVKVAGGRDRDEIRREDGRGADLRREAVGRRLREPRLPKSGKVDRVRGGGRREGAERGEGGEKTWETAAAPSFRWKAAVRFMTNWRNLGKRAR